MINNTHHRETAKWWSTAHAISLYAEAIMRGEIWYKPQTKAPKLDNKAIKIEWSEARSMLKRIIAKKV